MTLYTELSGFRARKLRIELSPTSLPDVDDFLCWFADGHSWTETGTGSIG